MGNPFVRSEAFQAGDHPLEPAVNGILARVPAQFIAQGSDQLPAAGPGQAAVAQVLVHDVPSLGTVRISYRLNSYKHGRSRRWHWVAVRADQAAGTAGATTKS